MQPGKQLKPALRALLISNIWILPASCSESIHEVDFVLTATRTLPIETLDAGVEDSLLVLTTPNPDRYDATWLRGRWVPMEEGSCGVRVHVTRTLSISASELEEAEAGFRSWTELTYTWVDWAEHARVGCLSVGRNPLHMVNGPNVFVKWVGDIPPHPVTVEILEPLGRLWNRVIREGETPSQENRRDVPIPAEEEGLWPQPEWSLGR